MPTGLSASSASNSEFVAVVAPDPGWETLLISTITLRSFASPSVSFASGSSTPVSSSVTVNTSDTACG